MAPCVCSMAECSTAAAHIGGGCSESEWCGCGLLRDSDARRIECQGKTRTEFSSATIGVGFTSTGSSRELQTSSLKHHQKLNQSKFYYEYHANIPRKHYDSTSKTALHRQSPHDRWPR